MPPVPRHTAGQVTRQLVMIGFERVGQEGSHEKWFYEPTRRTVIIPRHGNKAFGPRLMSKLLRDAGLTVEEYIAGEIREDV